MMRSLCAYAIASATRDHVRQQREPLVERARARAITSSSERPRDQLHRVERLAVGQRPAS